MKYNTAAIDADGDVWARLWDTANPVPWQCLTNPDKGSCGSDELIAECGPVSVLMVSAP